MKFPLLVQFTAYNGAQPYLHLTLLTLEGKHLPILELLFFSVFAQMRSFRVNIITTFHYNF